MKTKRLLLTILASGSLGAADLTDELYQKQQELSALTRQINEKFEYINSVGQKFINWTQNEDTSFLASLDEMIQEYYTRKKNNNFDDFIIKAIANKDENIKKSQFGSDARRFLWLSSILEYQSLELLFLKFERCLHEITLLENKLKGATK